MPPSQRFAEVAEAVAASAQPPPVPCHGCIRLLLDYVSAGNQVVELEHRNPSSLQLTCAMANRAKAYRLWTHYQRNRCCDNACPNILTAGTH